MAPGQPQRGDGEHPERDGIRRSHRHVVAEGAADQVVECLQPATHHAVALLERVDGRAHEQRVGLVDHGLDEDAVDAGRGGEDLLLGLGERQWRQRRRLEQVGVGQGPPAGRRPATHPVAGRVVTVGQRAYGGVGGSHPGDPAGDPGDRRRGHGRTAVTQRATSSPRSDGRRGSTRTIARRTPRASDPAYGVSARHPSANSSQLTQPTPLRAPDERPAPTTRSRPTAAWWTRRTCS